MANVNLFTSNLEGKALISEKSASRKAVSVSLADYCKSIDAEFTKVYKSDDKRARDVANAAKGKYQTALQVVVNCYPFQTAAGELATKKTTDAGERIWALRKLTAAAARSIVRESLNNFIKTVGQPEVTTVVIGQPVEK